MGVCCESASPTEVRECFDVGQRGIVQRERTCSRHGARHVGGAIVEHAFLSVGRVCMSRRTARFETVPLIDRDIDYDGTRPHPCNQVPCHELGSGRSRH